MKDTPSMRQYRDIKERYPDCLLFFRMGDFYEMFGDDAIILSKVLDIALTSRDKGEDKTPMAGIPHHALMSYLPKVIAVGYKVALCEQMEDPKTVKGLVKRDVVRVITPGTVIDPEMQKPNKISYILSLHFSTKLPKQKRIYGIAYIDIGGGSFSVYESSDFAKILEVIENINPPEILVSENLGDKIHEGLDTDAVLLQKKLQGRAVSVAVESDFTHGRTYIQEHFGTENLKGFLVRDMPEAINAGGALLKYVEDNQMQKALNIEKITELTFDAVMYLDPATVANLELLYPQSSSPGVLCLVDVLDKTKTGMGARLLRQSILYPLVKRDDILLRLSTVEYLYALPILPVVRELLSHISDIERIAARISFKAASPRDYLSLKASFETVMQVCSSFETTGILPAFIASLAKDEILRGQMQEIIATINKVISSEAASMLGSGDIINTGVDATLDELKDLLKNGKGWIRNFQENEVKRTGINSLKVHYNKVFGYYIEISNSHKLKVPDDYIRKQTLVNAERYITPLLKEKEDMIMGAQDRILVIEATIFKQFAEKMLEYIAVIQEVGKRIALLDMLTSFAFTAIENNYVMPEFIADNPARPISIIGGRHPVIEETIDKMAYIPNDVSLDCLESQVLLITGPNMSGKSSILRMVALISLMAQTGSFVPAKKAELSVVDRIFSRVGARDNLSLGESTFMVEMNETANILHNATPSSLIILDEIGRGTSTYDGVSIAYAVVEYIHQEIGAKTIFATHYHELIDMASLYKRVRNMHVKVLEAKDSIIFLRTLERGGTDKSYGIHVAKLAGVPKSVVKRAMQVLGQYEKMKEDMQSSNMPPLLSLLQQPDASEENIAIVEERDSIEESIKHRITAIDINTMSPLDAMHFLHDLISTLTEDD